EIRTLESGGWLLRARILRDQHAQRTRHIERQQSAAAEKPRRFGHGLVWVSEGHRAVIAEHDIEACIWQGNTLAAGVHQRKIDICSSHETARVQLARRVVETDRACATSRQSDGPLRRATAKLQHVFASNVAQDAPLVLADVPDP